MAKLIESFTPEQVEAFHRDGFLVVEEGLISDKALELLEQRYLRLFDGEYETGIKPDEVNWVKGRDPEDRTRQLCNAWRADTVIAAQVLSARIGRLAAQLMSYPGRPDPPGQRALEASRNEGDRLPPGRLVRRLPRSSGDGDVLDVAARDAGRRRSDRVRARVEPLAVDPAGALAVPRAGGLAGGRPSGEAGGRGDGGGARWS